MTSNPASDRGARVMLTAACAVVIVAGLRHAAPVALPVLTALFLSILSLPVQGWLQRRGASEGTSVVAALGVVMLAAAAVGVLLGGSMNRFLAKAPEYAQQLDGMPELAQAWVLSQVGADAQAWMLEHEVDLSSVIAEHTPTLGSVMEWTASGLTSATSLLSSFVLVLLLQAFIMLEAGRFPAKLQAAIGHMEMDPRRLQKIVGEVQTYFGVKTVVSAATGLLVGGWCWLLGIDFYVLWGVLGFVLNYIPNLGSILAAVPPVLVALVQHGPGTAAAAAIGYTVVNMVVGNVIEPRMLGQRLGLSALVVFLSMLFWGWVWGPVGMFLSVPLTMFVKILLENTHDLKWAAVLLSADAPVGKVQEVGNMHHGEVKIVEVVGDGKGTGSESETVLKQ